MQKIHNMCLSDFYGEAATNISNELFNKIREIIQLLYDNCIEYPDITGYNFIEKYNKLWIIYFEQASYPWIGYVLCLNGLIACVLNITSFYANQKTNALTMSVAGNVKQVLSILLSIFIFDLVFV